MKRAIQVTAGAAVCFGLGSYWSAANSQQPIAPELFRPRCL